ncbi:MAG: hypothetical protein C0404_05000 [Verrucomicrobia bacterium]|nr:hypothetical protein [Verrucomicrobiota bacterium]
MRNRGIVIVTACALCCLASFALAEDDPDIGGKPLSELIKQLRSDNRGFQMRASKALVEAPAELKPTIAPKVMPLLKSDRENDKFVAAQVLGECGPVARPAIPDLLPMLKGTQYERNRAAAAKALGQILKDAKPDKEVEDVADALISKLNEDYDGYSDVRREAMYAIGMIGPAAKKTIPKFLKGLTDYREHSSEHQMVRQVSAWTCGRMGPLAAEHMDRLLSMLQAEGDQIPEIAEAMGRIGPLNENVVMNLVDRLERLPGGWFPCKASAYGALEVFGPKALPALQYMMRVLRDTPGNRVPIEPLIAATKVCGKIGPAAKDALPLLEKMAKYESHPHAEISKEWHDKLHKAAEEALALVKAGGR